MHMRPLMKRSLVLMLLLALFSACSNADNEASDDQNSAAETPGQPATQQIP